MGLQIDHQIRTSILGEDIW